MHKEWLRFIGEKLDQYKRSPNPADNQMYEVIEKQFLAQTVSAIQNYENSKRAAQQAPQPQQRQGSVFGGSDGMPEVGLEDVL